MEAHDIPPQVAADWTPYQARMILCEEADLNDQVKRVKSLAEARKIIADRKFRKFLKRFG